MSRRKKKKKKAAEKREKFNPEDAQSDLDKTVGATVVESLKAAKKVSSRRPASWSPWFTRRRGESNNMGEVDMTTF